MKKTMLIGTSMLCAFVLAGCGPAQKVGVAQGGPISSSNQPITFFKNSFPSNVKLILSPDPFVKREMPNVAPPKTPVIVYLPVYPGATPSQPVSTIGDIGTPMNGDLVDGTLYFASKDSQAQITKWYKQQFQKLGYAIGGQGQSGKVGHPTTDFLVFTKNSPPGNPTRTPDISLGFLIQRQNDKTIFKLKPYYIVVPPRPKDSYLPTDIVKVVLTNGKVTKTITDKQWIDNVVQAINTLQVATPGINSGGTAVTRGTILTVTAQFYSRTGSMVNATFSFLSATVHIGKSDVMLNAGTSPTLEKNIKSVL